VVSRGGKTETAWKRDDAQQSVTISLSLSKKSEWKQHPKKKVQKKREEKKNVSGELIARRRGLERRE
jgi:hypothetical protein